MTEKHLRSVVDRRSGEDRRKLVDWVNDIPERRSGTDRRKNHGRRWADSKWDNILLGIPVWEV